MYASPVRSTGGGGSSSLGGGGGAGGDIVNSGEGGGGGGATAEWPGGDKSQGGRGGGRPGCAGCPLQRAAGGEGGGPQLLVTDALPLTYGSEGVTSAAVVEFGLLVAEALLEGAEEAQADDVGGRTSGSGGSRGVSSGGGVNGGSGGRGDDGDGGGRGRRGRRRGGGSGGDADDGGLAGCTLAGIYYANALLGDDAPGPVVTRIASRVAAKYPHAVAVGVDGGRLAPAVRLSTPAVRAYGRRDGVWRRVGTGLDAAAEVLAVVDVMLGGGAARRLVEWEDVCDEPSRDWLNRDLFVEGGGGEGAE